MSTVEDLKGAEGQPLVQLRLLRRGLRAEGLAVKGPAAILLAWIVLNITRNAPGRD